MWIVSAILLQTKRAYIASSDKMELTQFFIMCKGAIAFLHAICFGLLLPWSLMLFLMVSQSSSLASALGDVELFQGYSVNVQLVYFMGIVALIGIELVFDPIVSFFSNLCNDDERLKRVLPSAQLFRNARFGDVVLKLFYAVIIPEMVWFGVISVLFDLCMTYQMVKMVKAVM